MHTYVHVYSTCIKRVCVQLNTEDDVVQDFLWVDSCAKVADKVRDQTV